MIFTFLNLLGIILFTIVFTVGLVFLLITNRKTKKLEGYMGRIKKRDMKDNLISKN